MYHLNTRAGELPRSASSHFDIFVRKKLHALPGEQMSARLKSEAIYFKIYFISTSLNMADRERKIGLELY